MKYKVLKKRCSLRIQPPDGARAQQDSRACKTANVEKIQHITIKLIIMTLLLCLLLHSHDFNVCLLLQNVCWDKVCYIFYLNK